MRTTSSMEPPFHSFHLLYHTYDLALATLYSFPWYPNSNIFFAKFSTKFVRQWNTNTLESSAFKT